jgi:ABC-type transporter Mla subunit MlaD
VTATRPPRRRAGRSSAAAAETLQRLTAARADLDAAVVERRRREDALIEQYAAASGEIADVVARRDAALADLARRTREIRDGAAAELDEIQARQQQVLVELNHHRTLEELSTWFGVPEKRLRQILRAHRASGDMAGASGGSDRSDDVPEPRAPSPPRPPGVAEVPVAEPAPAVTTSVAGNGAPSPATPAPAQPTLRAASIRPAPSWPPGPADRPHESAFRAHRGAEG